MREASRRTTGMRHFDVQMIGGMVLHQGRIAEMKTGEGKTLVATVALYLNSLEGKGAHLVTVNDYLARRDVQWMGPIYHALGLSLASIIHEASFLYDPHHIVKDYRYQSLRPIPRRDAYLADITYGTNNEFGFDYLRDNMKFSLEEYVQRDLHYAIVDEVDNILIDEARTPLIISGPAEESTDKYYKIDRVIPKLRKEADYTIDEKLRQVNLTDEGVAKVERILGIPNLYDPTEIDTLHHVTQALRAHALYKKDVDYVVKDGQVIIVDEFTGRLMPGRRWSDGLHQAVEAKEGVTIERENQTLATITIQNYFRMYKKLAGMTGTADTEAVEFKSTYKLDVVIIPPNRKMVRDDLPDVVYRSEREKFEAVIEEIKECRERHQPMLVGTVSVEKSERLSKMLKKEGVRHNVLNAVNHELEASVIAQAGRADAVTIATNMAGRGTDILLGGNPEFLARAEMENEWIQRVAKLASPEGAPAKRYEETLREFREKYDEEVERIRNHYQPQLLALDEKRKEALRRRDRNAPAAARRIAVPRSARALRALRLVRPDSRAAVTAGPSPRRYVRVKAELEAALEDGSGAEVGAAAADFAAARVALDALLGDWSDPEKRASRANVDSLVRQTLERAAGQLGSSNGHSVEAFRRLVEQWSFAKLDKGETKTLADHLNTARVLYDRSARRSRDAVAAPRRRQQRLGAGGRVSTSGGHAPRGGGGAPRGRDAVREGARRGARALRDAAPRLRPRHRRDPRAARQGPARVPGALRGNPGEVQASLRRGARAGRGGGRTAHRRYRAAREPAHRQPAARPRGTPGRPRFLAVLPLARGRLAADLRRRPHPGIDAAARHGRGRADRAPADHARDLATRSRRSRHTTSTSASTCSSTTT